MKFVRVNSHFWANKDVGRTQDQVEALQLRMENLIAAWMSDTGLWDFRIRIRVDPAGKPGYFAVDSVVEVEAKPLRAEAGGVPVD